MSNSIIPHLLSDSPPPIAGNVDDDYDDEFGDFTGPGDLSFDNDNFSMPPTPKNTKKDYSHFERDTVENNYNINRKAEGNSSLNQIEKELPSKNYINILDHIESNVLTTENQKIENVLEADEKIECTLSTKYSEDQESCKNNRSDIHLHKTSNPKESVHEPEPILVNEIEDFEPVELFKASIEISNLINNVDRNEKEEILHVDFENLKLGGSENVTKSSDCNSADVKLDSRKESDHITKSSDCNSGIVKLDLRTESTDDSNHDDANCVDNFNIESDSMNFKALENKFDYIERGKLVEHNNDEDSEFTDFDNVASGTTSGYSYQLNNEKLYIEINDHEHFNEEHAIGPGEIAKNSPSLDKIEKSLEDIDNLKNKVILHTIKDNELITSNLNVDNCDILDNDDFGEFTDFNAFKFENDNKFEHLEQFEGDNFSEFANFENSFATEELNDIQHSKVIGEDVKYDKTITNYEKNNYKEESDQFDEFVDYSTFNQHENDNIGDFDNFSEYSSSNIQKSNCSESSGISEKLIQICSNSEEALEQSQIVLGKVFTITESDNPDYSNCDFTMDDSVFENLKDLTETNALGYQWLKSTAQKNILKTLNIDIRNILYGPSWNSGVPIFAANLCSTPLEPIRSDVPIPLTPQKLESNLEPDSSTIFTEVNAVDFDWNGAGLTNTLDSFENAEKQLGTTDDSKAANNDIEIPSVAESNSFEVTSKTFDFHKDTMPINSIELQVGSSENIKEVKENIEHEEEFSDFTSYQPKYEQEIDWSNMLPLRESHIFYQSPNILENVLAAQVNMKRSTDKCSTSINFDVTVPDSNIDNLKSSEFKSHIESDSNFHIDINEFESFASTENKLSVKESLSIFDDIKGFKTDKNLHPLSIPQKDQTLTIALPYEGDSSQHLPFSQTIPEKGLTCNKDPVNHYEEDEFTDFHSSLPKQTNSPIKPVLSFPEPLRPSVLQPICVNNQPVAKIEWPEPGLDEEEINRIVTGCLRRNSEPEKGNDCQQEPTIRKESSLTEPKQIASSNDDDEWSDFVSVKEPIKSRTATPDLPLSVFNLGNIQPVKAPTPLVTANGLMSSPVKKPLANITVPKTNMNLQRNIQHPFITSQAFDALYKNPKKSIIPTKSSVNEIGNKSCNTCGDQPKNFFGKFFDKSVSQNGSANYGDFQSSSPSVSKNSADDDEWGDFVSATNASSFTNSDFNPMQSSTRIITNPSHNMGSFNNKAPTQQYSSSSRSTVVIQERRNIPSISALPDLEFMSPKSRGVKK